MLFAPTTLKSLQNSCGARRSDGGFNPSAYIERWVNGNKVAIASRSEASLKLLQKQKKKLPRRQQVTAGNYQFRGNVRERGETAEPQDRGLRRPRACSKAPA